MPIQKHRPLAAPFHSPRVIVVIDTEEEFDWSAAYSREAVGVRHMQHLDRLQSIFDAFAIRPVYVVDHAVAAQDSSAEALRPIFESNRAILGAHLHSWITPPFTEELSRYNSYQGNLDRELEAAKLAALTNQIERTFGERPTIFKAGRYGIGPHTYELLAELGYRIDLSPAPPLDSSADGGPDYSRAACHPYQDEKSRLLVLPNTGGFVGWLAGGAPAIHRWATSGWRSRIRANSLVYRSGAVERLMLSPEGSSQQAMVAITKYFYDRGSRCFVLSLHSPSIMAGGTPFATDEAAVSALLKRLRSYLQFFIHELGGEPWTPGEALAYWSSQPEWMSQNLAMTATARRG